MGINNKRLKIFAAVILLAALIAIYQNCGSTSSTSPFDITFGSSGISGGTITNTTQISGKLALGYSHSCALNTSGGVQCWGEGNSGQLGYGALEAYSLTPVTVAGLNGTPIKITGGAAFSCALLTSGSVECWGDDSYGQLGNNAQSTNSPSAIAASVERNMVYDIATSYYATCVVLGNGIVQCWGLNTSGELGNGTSTTVANSLTPVTVTGITNAVRITAGETHFCATLITGAVSCWGQGSSGQLGNQIGAVQYSPVSANGVSSPLKVAAGALDTCALFSGGNISCWGDNNSGELGDGNVTATLAVTSVINISSASDISAGYTFECAIVGSGVQCWGDNKWGELGNNSATSSSVPVAVSGLNSATAISAGGYHACAYLSSGAVQCWGDNTYGELGNGGGPNAISNVPVTVSGFN